MRSPTPARPPLAVVHTTALLCTLASTGLLLALVFALIDPGWSRAALALQAVALLVVALAAPSGRARPAARGVVLAALLRPGAPAGAALLGRGAPQPGEAGAAL